MEGEKKREEEGEKEGGWWKCVVCDGCLCFFFVSFLLLFLFSKSRISREKKIFLRLIFRFFID